MMMHPRAGQLAMVALISLCSGCAKYQGRSHVAVGSGNARDDVADRAAGMYKQVAERFLPCY